MGGRAGELRENPLRQAGRQAGTSDQRGLKLLSSEGWRQSSWTKKDLPRLRKLWHKTRYRAYHGTFWDERNVLCLVSGGDYMNV